MWSLCIPKSLGPSGCNQMVNQVVSKKLVAAMPSIQGRVTKGSAIRHQSVNKQAPGGFQDIPM